MSSAPLLQTIEPDDPGDSVPSGTIGSKTNATPKEQVVLTPTNNAASGTNPNATPADMESG